MPVIDAPAAPAESACPVCGEIGLRKRFDKFGYAVLGCRGCGLELLRPQPSNEVLAEVYREGYFLGAPTPEQEGQVQRMKRATAALYAERLAQKLPERGRVLELGCGRGEFLLEAQARGFDVYGIEFSRDAAAVANQRLASERVQVGTIEDVPQAPGIFDALVAADVLEHVRDPMGFLRRAHELLRPGGVLLLITPALDSLSARLLGRHWMEYKVEHLYYFSRLALRTALQRTGFHAIETSSNLKVLSFGYVHEHFRRFRVPVLSPLFDVLRAALPDRLASRHWRIPASGLLATARK